MQGDACSFKILTVHITTVKKRLFIAIDISVQARQLAAAHAEELKRSHPDSRVSWTKPGNLHLTLKFLGDVEEERIADVIDSLRRVTVGTPSFRLEISGAGVFPSARKPKVLWLGVHDTSGQLRRIAKVIDEDLNGLGFPREDREFSPHLTIGRIRDSRNGREVAEAHSKYTFEPVKFAVAGLVLYSSKLSSSGSEYTPIARFKLDSTV